MSRFVEIQGDLFNGIKKVDNATTIVIPHCTNDLKICGAGFIVPLFKNFPEAKTAYFKERPALGEVSYGWIGRSGNKYLPRFYIANMCAQSGVKPYVEKPGKYVALIDCMVDVKYQLDSFKINWDGYSDNAGKALRPVPKIEIHAPRFGSDRAGLCWEFIRELITEIWGEYNVTIYYL